MKFLKHSAVLLWLLFPLALNAEAQPQNVQQLEQLFEAVNYHWPSEHDIVPQLILTRLPTGFDRIRDASKRKRLFIQIMTPIALMEIQRLEEQRALALLLASRDNLHSPRWRPWLSRVSQRYGLRTRPGDEKYADKLAHHLDGLPLRLVIAQAAIESGWGSSRFAMEGNSLFGQWTTNGKGMVPGSRNENATHRVAAYPSLQASVKSYLQNINTNRAYRKLRTMRSGMRLRNQRLDPFKLAEGLDKYSQRGDDYVAELQSIMRSDEFKPLTRIQFQPAMAESTADYASETGLKQDPALYSSPDHDAD